MIRFTRDFFRRRLIQPLMNFLKQGITPTKLALAVSLGFALGIFPVIGSTIILCTVFGFALRLNIPAIQLINGFVYPLQLILYIPFFHIMPGFSYIIPLFSGFCVLCLIKNILLG